MNSRIELIRESIKKAKKDYEDALKVERNTLLISYLETAKVTVGNAILENADCSIDLFNDNLCYNFYENLHNNILDKCRKDIGKVQTNVQGDFANLKNCVYTALICQIDSVILEIRTLLKSGILITENLCTDKFPVPEDLYYEVVPEANLKEYKAELVRLKECDIDSLKSKDLTIPSDFATENYLFIDELLDELKMLLLYQ